MSVTNTLATLLATETDLAATAAATAAATPRPEFEQYGIFRLRCADDAVIYGQLDLATEIAATGVEPTATIMAALKQYKGRAPAVQVYRADGKRSTRLAPDTIAKLLRDIGIVMADQAAAILPC